MTLEYWDADEAVVLGPLDAELDGMPSIDRFGVRPDEVWGEPLDVSLSQEELETTAADSDDEWALVENDTDFEDRPSLQRRESPEELALHVEMPT